MRRILLTAALGVLAFASNQPGLRAAPESDSPRRLISLDGDWQFCRDPVTNAWKTIRIPSSFQTTEGTNFHGVGWYRKKLPPLRTPPHTRVLLHFEAAATEARVWLDDQELGTHLGGWTPFRFDVTHQLASGTPGQQHELKVRLDEKVGHNTQGFLPIIAPHFGGIWQGVSLLTLPETGIDDLRVFGFGDVTGGLRLEIPLLGSETISNVELRSRELGQSQWTTRPASVRRSNDTLLAETKVPDARLWSPVQPALYEIQIALPGSGGDRVTTRAAFRKFEAVGPQFRLNGHPINVRGLLNWGYSAPRIEPNPGEVRWRSEIEFAKTNGFNLMKFCLWIPPRRYLELADEMGMLTWMEYPTWHPKLSANYLEPLRREFTEFFYYDRIHPSVVLRSLTCETGPSADLGVIQNLYDTAHALIPASLVEDDSSWIEWNRVNDFYDDHPYGNNHTWVKTLAGFNEYILSHGLKPLVLGETTAADTWVDRTALLQRVGSERPWWVPGCLDDTSRWLERMRALGGDGGLEELHRDSLRYALLMRKFQIEAFRREVPYGGYVISVIRDFSTASMGLLDYLDRPKWNSADWEWQRDTMCLLKTARDRRSFKSGEKLQAEVLLSHFGLQPISHGLLTLRLESDSHATLQQFEITNLQQNAGTLAKVFDLDWALPSVSSPTRVEVRTVLAVGGNEFRNEWPLWVVPAVPADLTKGVCIHRSLDSKARRDLFAGCADFDARSAGQGAVLVASRFDDELVRFLEGGGRVLLLPDGQEHSLPVSAHWFLRGAPYLSGSVLGNNIPRDFFIELQHFDLADQVVPNVPQLDSWDPILYLWDTHDQQTVRTHGIIFETQAAKGRLLVSSAQHAGNPAGSWLLGLLLEHLRAESQPRHHLTGEVWEYLKACLHAEQTNLVTRTWKFKPDPRNEGLAQGWHRRGLSSEAEWKDLRIGAWWESQGYPDLDGWAWYRLWVDIPAPWAGRNIFLSFEGVDDIYELYVNGELAGKGGDLATHRDALNEKKSHDISRFVTPASRALIAVRVHDWFGAGGIFRPVILGTVPFRPELDLLK